MIREKTEQGRPSFMPAKYRTLSLAKKQQIDAELHVGKKDVLLIWMIGSSYFKIRKDVCRTDATVPTTWRDTPTPYEPSIRFGLPIQTCSAPR
jgi:hypothetical protein